MILLNWYSVSNTSISTLLSICSWFWVHWLNVDNFNFGVFVKVRIPYDISGGIKICWTIHTFLIVRSDDIFCRELFQYINVKRILISVLICVDNIVLRVFNRSRISQLYGPSIVSIVSSLHRFWLIVIFLYDRVDHWKLCLHFKCWGLFNILFKYFILSFNGSESNFG